MKLLHTSSLAKFSQEAGRVPASWILCWVFLLALSFPQMSIAQRSKTFLKYQVSLEQPEDIHNVTYVEDPATGRGYLAGLAMDGSFVRLHDVETGKIDRRIPIPKYEDQHGYSGYHAHSPDSIWLVVSGKPIIVLMDGSGTLRKTVLLPEKLGDSSGVYRLAPSTLTFANGLLHVIAYSPKEVFCHGGCDLGIHPDSGIVMRWGSPPDGWQGARRISDRVLAGNVRIYPFSNTDTVWMVSPHQPQTRMRQISSPRYVYTKMPDISPSENRYYAQLMEFMVTHPQVDELLYDPYRQRYLRVVRWADKYRPKKGQVIGVTEKKWSIQVYDKHLVPVQEIVFPPRIYYPYGLIVGREGIFVQKQPTFTTRKLDYSTLQKNYEVFDF